MPRRKHGTETRAAGNVDALPRYSDADIAATRASWLTPRGRLVAGIMRRLDRLEELAGEALLWTDALAARELVNIGLAALANPGHAESRDAVRTLDAVRQRRQPDSPELKIRELARLVGIAAFLRKRRNEPHYADAGRGAAAVLREGVVALLGPTEASAVPSVDRLAGMLDLHSDHKARGKLTTIGIVADILIASRALGVQPRRQTRADVVRRVDTALRKARRRIAGMFIPPPLVE